MLSAKQKSTIIYNVGQGYGIEKVNGISARVDGEGEDGGRNLTLQAYLTEDDLIISGKRKQQVKKGSLAPNELIELLLQVGLEKQR